MTMLHVVEAGDGLPVLALHGWTPDHRLMTGCLEPVFAARPGYRRLYPDLPGMGHSPATGINSSDDVLAAIRELIEERIGTQPFLVIGESYGGYLARALANALPEQVLGLALICPIGVNLDNDRRTVPEPQALRTDPELLASIDPATAKEFAEVAVVQNATTLARFEQEILPGLQLADAEAMARIKANWALREGPEREAPFTRPSLIICGRQDDSVGYVDQFALLPHYPRASFGVLDVAGHNLQIEQPELFGTLINDWLDRVADHCSAANGSTAALPPMPTKRTRDRSELG
jgi:pimeloyl-ACP methyl ester carboxylesterase